MVEDTMKFRWETEKERLLRGMRISPERKLEWLLEMNEWLARTSPARRKFFRRHLRRL